MISGHNHSWNTRQTGVTRHTVPDCGYLQVNDSLSLISHRVYKPKWVAGICTAIMRFILQLVDALFYTVSASVSPGVSLHSAHSFFFF